MNQLLNEIRKKDAKAFTHGGKFHADDVFSAALLLYLNPEIQISRGNQVPEDFDGIVFDSRKEAKRDTELKKLEEMGSIRDLSLQVQFELIPSFEIVIDGKKRKRICLRKNEWIHPNWVDNYAPPVDGASDSVYGRDKHSLLCRWGRNCQKCERI